jgi:two-component system CheB/CheR fusion protein
MTAPGGHPPDAAELERIVQHVGARREFDIRAYKRSTLYRRLRKRMGDAGCRTADEYLSLLRADEREYGRLIDSILINVTEFFRDPEAWECLEALLRERLAARPAAEPLRAWSVGCANGAEPFTLAILLKELLPEGAPAFKVYATDIDEDALAAARAAIYAPDDLRNLSAERLERCFEPRPGGRYGVRRDLRSCVVLGRHNVLGDPPISRLDLLVCRNLLIYFDPETQSQLFPRFHYALREEGVLFLGKAETLMSRSTLFRPLEPPQRIFEKLPAGVSPN